jgi:hypothetical protein
MEPDTLLAILRPEVKDLGHGVRLCKVDAVESCTLVAFVATGGTLRVGYAYRNGSNIIVYCRDRHGNVSSRSPPVGVLIISFADHITQKRGHELVSADFDIDWFSHDAITLISAELGAHIAEWEEAFDDLIDSLMGLTVKNLRKLARQINGDE